MKTAFASHRIIEMRINMIYYVNLCSKNISTIIFEYGFKLTEPRLFFTYLRGAQHASSNS